jgi:mannose-6-phosphate isomerase-like protein (cupin superfamily)
MRKGFKVILSNRRGQVAQMVLTPGDSEGDSSNRHKGADQWLFVVSGRGLATINDRKVQLKPGTLLLIEQNDRHEIKNIGRALLKTLNFYTPPAYNSAGAELPRGREN